MRRLFLGLLTLATLSAQELRQHPDRSYKLTYAEAVAYCAQEPGWRLPTVKELFSLIHDHSDQINHASQNYWSSTDFITDPNRAWQMLNPDMDAMPMDKSNKLNALCVKKTPVHEDLRRRYEIKEGLIFDTKNSLYWQPIEHKDRRNRYNHVDAANRCASLELGGMTWRLPTLKELFSIVEYNRFNPALDKKIFKYTYPRYYWSADARGDFSNEAYVVGMKIGSVALSSKVNESFVRCVSEGKKK